MMLFFWRIWASKYSRLLQQESESEHASKLISGRIVMFHERVGKNKVLQKIAQRSRREETEKSGSTNLHLPSLASGLKRRNSGMQTRKQNKCRGTFGQPEAPKWWVHNTYLGALRGLRPSTIQVLRLPLHLLHVFSPWRNSHRIYSSNR